MQGTKSRFFIGRMDRDYGGVDNIFGNGGFL